MLKKQATAPVDALRDVIAAFREPESVAAMRTRAAELEARLAELDAAHEENSRHLTLHARRDRVEQYLSGGVDVVDERTKLSRERGLATEALRTLRDRIASAAANARAEFAMQGPIPKLAAEQRERLMVAAVAFFQAATEAREMTDAAGEIDVPLAGALWTGNEPSARAFVGGLIDSLAEAGVPVHPHVRRDAAIACGRRMY